MRSLILRQFQYLEWKICSLYSIHLNNRNINQTFVYNVIHRKLNNRKVYHHSKPKHFRNPNFYLDVISSCSYDGLFIRVVCSYAYQCYGLIDQMIVVSFNTTKDNIPVYIYNKPGELYILYQNNTISKLVLSENKYQRNNYSKDLIRPNTCHYIYFDISSSNVTHYTCARKVRKKNSFVNKASKIYTVEDVLNFYV